MANVVRVNINTMFDPNDTLCTNIFYYQYSPVGTPSLTDLDDLWNLINAPNQLIAKHLTCMTTDMDYRRARLTYMGRNGVFPFFAEKVPTAVGGLRVPPTLPLQVTAVVRKRSSFAKRWGMGRVFIPGLPQSDVTNNVVVANTPLDISLADLANYMPVQLTGALYLWKPVLVRSSGQDVDGGPITTSIVAGAYDTITRSQRRRQTGVGQ